MFLVVLTVVAGGIPALIMRSAGLAIAGSGQEQGFGNDDQSLNYKSSGLRVILSGEADQLGRR